MKTIQQKKLRKSKHISDYFIEKYKSGIYMICFNTKERRIYFHQAADDVYMFKENESVSEDSWEVITVKEFLPKTPMFLHTQSQCKDQIYFYFIPFKLVDE